MESRLIRNKALAILSKPKPTKLELEWWLNILEEYKLDELKWDNNLSIDIPLSNRKAPKRVRLLNDKKCYEIRSTYMRGNVTQNELAATYGVSRETIYLILYPQKRIDRNEQRLKSNLN